MDLKFYYTRKLGNNNFIRFQHVQSSDRAAYMTTKLVSSVFLSNLTKYINKQSTIMLLLQTDNLLLLVVYVLARLLIYRCVSSLGRRNLFSFVCFFKTHLCADTVRDSLYLLFPFFHLTFQWRGFTHVYTWLLCITVVDLYWWYLCLHFNPGGSWVYWDLTRRRSRTRYKILRFRDDQIPLQHDTWFPIWVQCELFWCIYNFSSLNRTIFVSSSFL